MTRKLLLYIALLLCGCDSDRSQGAAEFDQKPVWADLQGIEFRNRENYNLPAPVLLKGEIGPKGYDVIAVPVNKNESSSAYRYVWIVINANAGKNKIYMMPNESALSLSLPCDFLNELKKNEKIDYIVSSFLELHCTPPGPAAR